MTGEVDIPPHLHGKDRPPAFYVCALLTAKDLHNCSLGDDDDDMTPSSHSHLHRYRLVLIYNRRSFTAAWCFSSDTRQWGAEARVIGASVGRIRQHTAIVHRGVVFWPRLKLALLTLPTASNETTVVKGMSTHHVYRLEESLLGLLPDGSLCWAEVSWDSKIRLFFCGSGADDDMMLSLHEKPFSSGRRWRLKRTIMLGHIVPKLSSWPITPPVKLRWFCERSGVILFTIRKGCYTLNLKTMEVDKVTNSEPLLMVEEMDMMYGYEMDRLTFLASLGAGHISPI
ncbi:hypothetical protein E2562_024779 [Oryza meyeriana var. granulata]|uniref:F-box associated domain-containing protein n=1 Tax=Oryza meyeriana var. granulata TaxID=110450 RepID=A0A6G1E1S8_9ORYZ|nr:hypothetical protein E2562_024779 [Oryza meyeriana var. granulata]